MYAKIYGPDDDQVLVLRSAGEDGDPAVIVYFLIPSLGLGAITFSFKNTTTAQECFDSLGAAEARSVVDRVRSERSTSKTAKRSEQCR